MNSKKLTGYVRKKKLVHKRIQLSSAIIVLSISFFSFIILCGIIFGVSEYLSRQVRGDIDKLSDAIRIQQTIVTAVDTFAKSISSEEYELAITNVLKDSDRSFQLIHSHISRISLFIRYHIYILIAMLAVQLICLVFLFRYMILFSYRFCGPEKVITGMVRKIRAGEKIHPRPLRKGDYLQPLYDEIIALAEKNNLIEKKGARKE